MSGAWVIAGEKKGVAPTIGKFYELRHSRKGTFKVQVNEVSGEWATCTIVEGVARAAMSYNVKYEGDELQVRDTLSYWIPLEGKP
jgi:hypothetical protein